MKKRWVKIVVNIIKWSLLTAYIIVILSFVNGKSNQLVCTSININIKDSLESAFITKHDVLKTLEKKNDTPIGKPLWAINTHEMEQRFLTQHVIKSIAIYKTANGALNVNITQRKPMVRIINKHGKGYYIDNDGLVLPLSRNYTSHVLVMNGKITEPFEIAPNVRLTDWAPTDEADETTMIYKIYELAKFITDAPFWNAQITQVYVDGPNDIELIPRVGSHIVQLGSPDDLEAKFKKLKLFYERALPTEGWNKYKIINLKYKNQIVCTKR